MARVFIQDGKGNDVKNSRGERLFYSTSDGDPAPKTSQTVYAEHRGAFYPGSRRIDDKYDPSSRSFKK